MIPEVDKNCLKDLLLTDPRNDKLRIEQSKGGLLQDSFSWILGHPTFHRWQLDREVNVLWLRGDAGKGKTMLMIGLIDTLCHGQSFASRTDNRSPFVSYFLCQANDSRLNNATAILRGLLYLVMAQQPFLLQHLRSRYESTGRQLFEGPDAVYSLSELLLGLLQSSDLPEIYFIVDAIDECEENLPQLLSFIKRSAMANTNLKWIVSSRNRDDIEQQLGSFGKLASIKLESVSDQILEAIKHFIDVRISELASLANNQSLQSQLKDRILEKSDGTFLWAALVIAELGKDVFESEMLPILEESPIGLAPLSDKMMERIKKLHSRNASRCFRVLAVVSLTYRPLHLLQLGVVAGLSDVVVSIAEFDRLVNMCGSFLSIRDEHVFFIHQSAKDYLMSNHSHAVFHTLQSQVHFDIYLRSVETMSKGLHRDMLGLNDPGPIDDDSREEGIRTCLVPLEYSCVHWLDHLTHSMEESSRYRKELRDGQTLHLFFTEHLLHFLEVLGILREIPQVISAIRKLLGLLMVCRFVK